jgi:putative hydrolase of HD superfamily
MKRNIRKEIIDIHELFLLKEVERRSRVKGRYESSAEHTWSCMILAQYFIPKVSQFLDEKKVMKMLLYHDLIEIESGDTFFFDDNLTKEQSRKEHLALEKMKKRVPKSLSNDFLSLWQEFEENTTPEAKFSQAIDKLDPIIQSSFKKEDWRKNGINEKNLREKKQEFFEPFPEMKSFFEEFIRYAKRNNYF